MTPPLRLTYRQFDGFARSFSEQAAAMRASDPSFAMEMRALDVGPLYQEMVERRGCLTGEHDLFLTVTDWLPALIRDGMIAPLDQFLTESPPQDWPGGWPDSLLHLQRDSADRVYGLPYHDGPEVLLYRADLFEDAGERDRFQRQHHRDLAPPRTWSEFLEVARFFHRPADDFYGCIVAAAPDGHNDVYDFFIHLWSRGGQFLDARHRPTFGDGTGEQALRFLQRLTRDDQLTQPEPWRYDSVAAGTAFAAGQAAMMWNWVGFQAVADLPDSPTVGLTRATMLPAGDGPAGTAVSLIVYWVLTIPTGSPRPDAAWRFMRHVASPAMDKVTALAGGSAVRRSTWDDPKIRARFGGYAVMEEAHRRARTLPAIPEYPALNDVIDRMMAAVIVDARAPRPALTDAVAEVESILDAAGYYRT